MRISYQTFLMLFICLLATVLFFIGISIRYQALTQLDSQHLNSNAQVNETEYLQANISQWLTTIDLFFSHKEGYLSNSIQLQALQLRTKLYVLHENMIHPEKLQSQINELQESIHRISQMTREASNLSAAEGSQWQQLIVSCDKYSYSLVKTMEELLLTVHEIQDSSALIVQSERKLFYLTIIISFAIYIAIFIALWHWATISIVKPLELLTQSADLKKIQTEYILFNLHKGPREVRQLAASFANYSQHIIKQNRLLTQQLNELKQTRLQLIQTEKLASIGQLSAGIAHEINNPVGYISSNLNTLNNYIQDMTDIIKAYQSAQEQLQDVDPENPLLLVAKRLSEQRDINFEIEDSENILHEVTEGVEKIKMIVSDLLTFSHVDNSDIVKADLNQIIDKTIKVAWNMLKYKTEIRREFSDLPVIQCNGGKLSQVFLNLLINASHAIKDTGIITIRTGSKPGHVWAEIEDTGCGISESEKIKIFDPFFTTKDAGEGTGLGLHIVQSIVEHHKGEVHVKSELGKGTTFHIDLPIDGLVSQES